MRARTAVLALVLMPTLLVAQDAPPPLKQESPKNPTTARVIGIIPGAGHVYAGEPGRGVLYLGATLGVAVLGATALALGCLNDYATDCDDSGSWETIATALILGFWGWTIYDAGRAAHRTNERRALRASLLLTPIRIPAVTRHEQRAINVGVTLARN